MEDFAARLARELDAQLRAGREQDAYWADKAEKSEAQAREAGKNMTERWEKRIAALQRRDKERREAQNNPRRSNDGYLGFGRDDEMKDDLTEIDEMVAEEDRRLAREAAEQRAGQSPSAGPSAYSPPPVPQPAAPSARPVQSRPQRRPVDDDDDFEQGSWLH